MRENIHLRTFGSMSRPGGRRSSQADGYNFVNADSTATMISLHHKMNIAILGLVPVALATSSTALQMPLDLLLGIALPVHGHIGMNLVGTDYFAKVFGKTAVAPLRMGVAVFTGVTMLGLFKLNLTGPGITESVKSFWRPKP